jgi:hypothetical protein
VPHAVALCGAVLHKFFEYASQASHTCTCVNVCREIACSLCTQCSAYGESDDADDDTAEASAAEAAAMAAYQVGVVCCAPVCVCRACDRTHARSVCRRCARFCLAAMRSNRNSSGRRL